MKKWLGVFLPAGRQVRNEWVLVFLFSSILIFISFIPFFHQLAQTPKDRVFLGVHNNILDYPMFIADIKQAKAGIFPFYVQYTSEEQKPTFVHYPYLFLGWIGRIFNLEAIALYHIGRVLFGLLMAVSFYYFICQVFSDKTKRLSAFLLTLFSGGLIKSVLTSEGARQITTYLTWWTGGDTIRRATFQPHAMFKTALLVFSLAFIGKYIKNYTPGGSKKYFFAALFLVPFLGLLDPVGVAAVMGLLWAYLVFWSIFSWAKGRKIVEIIFYLMPYAAYSIAFIPFLIYMNWVFRETPWRSIKEFEKAWHTMVPFWEYAGQFGITLFTGFVGSIFLIFDKRRSVFTWFTLGLVIPTLVLMLTRLSQQLGFYNLRFFGIPLYLFAAIASTALFWQIARLIAKWRGLALVKAKKYLLVITLIVIIPSVPTYFVSIKAQKAEFQPQFFNIYPTKTFLQAAKWMEVNIPFDKVVVSNDLIGGIVPAASGNRVYIGHIVSTLNYQEKKAKAAKFLGGKMTKKEAADFVRDGNIDYVIAAWGEQQRIEKNYGFMLIKLFENTEVSIYKIVPSEL